MVGIQGGPVINITVIKITKYIVKKIEFILKKLGKYLYMLKIKWVSF